MKSGKSLFALLPMTAVIALTACGRVENSADISGDTGSSYFNAESTTSGEPSSAVTTPDESEAASSADTSISEFDQEDADAFWNTVNCAVVTYLHNDRENLSKYLADPNYDTGLSEDSSDLLGKLDYILLKNSASDILPEDDGVYPLTFEYVVAGTDMVMYLDLGLKSIDGVWKVVYIALQG